MALKATNLQGRSLGRGHGRTYYGDHGFTIARHPSETDERMMVRVLAFAMYADRVASARAVRRDEGPVAEGLTDVIERWIDVGQPERVDPQGCGARAKCGRELRPAADIWWSGVRDKLARQSNLTVWNLAADAAPALATLVDRSMRLHVRCRTDRYG